MNEKNEERGTLPGREKKVVGEGVPRCVYHLTIGALNEGDDSLESGGGGVVKTLVRPVPKERRTSILVFSPV